MARSLVVDASVARSAGTTEHPVSKACRDFLQEIAETGHRLAVDKEVVREWRKHQSGFSLAWFGTMVRKRRVDFVACSDRERQALAEAIETCARLSAGDKAAVQKDAHLVHCAWGSDGLVSSLDDTVRKLLADLACDLKTIGGIVWVNPTKASECAVTWLKSGARSEAHRRLDAFPRT